MAMRGPLMADDLSLCISGEVYDLKERDHNYAVYLKNEDGYDMPIQIHPASFIDKTKSNKPIIYFKPDSSKMIRLFSAHKSHHRFISVGTIGAMYYKPVTQYDMDLLLASLINHFTSNMTELVSAEVVDHGRIRNDSFMPRWMIKCVNYLKGRT